MGTVHMAHDWAFAHFDRALECFDACTIYAGETDLDKMGKLVTAFNTPEDWTKGQHKRKVKKYNAFFKKMTDFELEQFGRTWPLMLQPLLIAGAFKNERKSSLDQALWTNAKNKGMKMCGLESVNRQLDILENIPLSLQVKTLFQAIGKIRNFRQQHVKMLNHYRQGNIHILQRLAKKNMGTLRRLMIYERNTDMVRYFCDIAETGPLFCSVGVGHLSGEKGMLRLLKQKGFKLKLIIS